MIRLSNILLRLLASLLCVLVLCAVMIAPALAKKDVSVTPITIEGLWHNLIRRYRTDNAPVVTGIPVASSETIAFGSGYSSPSVSCVDDHDTIANPTNTGATVNSSVAADYIEVYTCTDLALQTHQLTHTVTVSPDTGGGGSGIDYNVGVGQPMTTLAEVPWSSLAAGDTVYIHAGTYKEKICVTTQGTAQDPIRVIGVPDGLGNRPVIDGEDATTPASCDLRYTGAIPRNGLVFVMPHGDAEDIPDNPEYIQISGLVIKNVKDSYSFTQEGGGTTTYDEFGAGVYLRNARHILIEDNEILDNGQGVFCWSGEGPQAGSWYGYGLCENITIRGNYFAGNSNAGSYHEHQIYTEGLFTLIEYNYFGPQEAGSLGSQIKDRSAGTIIRYNYITQPTDGYVIDLVEPELGEAALIPHAYYDQAFVYGNIFYYAESRDTNYFHWNEDHNIGNGRIEEANGRLFYYHNTLVAVADSSDYGGWLPYFNVHEGGWSCPSSHAGVADLRNNAFVLIPTAGGAVPEARVSHCNGNLTYNMNYFTAGWVSNTNATVVGEGTNVTIANDKTLWGFADIDNGDLHLAAGSPLIGAAGPLPAEATSNVFGLDLTPVYQFVDFETYYTPRTLGDIGAYDYVSPEEVAVTVTADLGSTTGVETLSFAVPFKQGDMTDTSKIRLMDTDGTTEIPIQVSELATWPIDGSVRSVLVMAERDMNLNDVDNLTLQIGANRTANANGLSPEPDGLMVAVLPSSWYTDNRATGKPMEEAGTASVAYQSWYDTKMEEQALATVSVRASKTDPCASNTSNRRTYYDSMLALWTMFIRTEDIQYYRLARAESTWYKANEPELIVGGAYAGQGIYGNVCSSYGNDWNPLTEELQFRELRTMYGEGLMVDYLLSGDATSKDIAIGFAKGLAHNLAELRDPNPPTRPYGNLRVTERNAGWPMMAFASAYALDQTDTLISDAMFSLFDELVSWQSIGNQGAGGTPSGAFEHDLYIHDTSECNVGTGNEFGGSPWMTALVYDGVMDYFYLTRDARVPDMILQSANWLMSDAIVSNYGVGDTNYQYEYLWNCSANTDTYSELSGMTLAIAGAAYALTGDAAVLAHADEVADYWTFDTSGMNNNSTGHKQWQQKMRSYPSFLAYRNLTPATEAVGLVNYTDLYDDFDGSVSPELDTPKLWDLYNDEVNVTMTQSSGELVISVDSSGANDYDTTWWQGYEGEMLYVTFPAVDDFELILRNAGIGSVDTGNAYQFSGLIVWKEPLAYEFNVIGKRWDVASTIEYKVSSGGSSSQGDLLADAVPNYRGDLRVTRESGVVKFWYQNPNPAPYDTANDSWTENLFTNVTRLTGMNGELRVGIIAYGYVFNDDFTGHVDRVEIPVGTPQ